jgi:hypothetical protein
MAIAPKEKSYETGNRQITTVHGNAGEPANDLGFGRRDGGHWRDTGARRRVPIWTAAT